MSHPALSRFANRLALEIDLQDWSDAHTRLDGARHNRAFDRKGGTQLDPDSVARIKLNVIWVVAQALSDEDPNFDLRAFAEAAGAAPDLILTRQGKLSGGLAAGIRHGSPAWLVARESDNLILGIFDTRAEALERVSSAKEPHYLREVSIDRDGTIW